MRLKENATDEKLRGGYYTPERLASFIVDWGFSETKIKSILEPSCGDGVFLGCLLDKSSQYQCTAIELDDNEAKKASSSINNSKKISIINDDFYNVYEQTIKDKTFDLVIGNPPYIRYQYLTEQQRKNQSSILSTNGLKPNKLINSWVSFVVACTQVLSDNGKIGFVIPAELLQVAYAKDLRKYLMKKLQRITIVTFKELVFPNVQQEIVLLLGEKYSNHDQEHQIRILEYQDIEELIDNFRLERTAFQNIKYNDSKWTRYFLRDIENDLIDTIKKDDRFVRFDKIAEADIGITTGNNDFFCADKNTVLKYNLESVVRPLIARSVSIRGIRFTYDDWIYNIDKGAKAYLIDFPENPYEEYPDGYKEYIKMGEESGQNIGFKCSVRDRWYRVPSIWQPDAFFLRRNHLYPKFILNTDLRAVSTDTMHRIRFKTDVNPERVLISYYNSIALAFTEIEGRSYGGGVLEILPGELERIIMPKISGDVLSEKEVEYFVQLIDMYERNDDRDILGLLEIIDEELLVGKLNISRDIVLDFRKMWITLRDRRLKRGKK